MAENELKIKVSSDGGTTINQLNANIKELNKEFKSARIGSIEFDIAAKELKKTLEAKSKATAVAATENAKLMKSYFALGENLRKNTNPAFISFNQIIQDAPFGIRGVGNNIQFLTQQFTQLRAAGMSTGEILKGMIQNALTPMGLLMFSVSAGTTLLTLAMDHLGKTSETTEQKVETLKTVIDELNDAIKSGKQEIIDRRMLDKQVKMFEEQIANQKKIIEKARKELPAGSSILSAFEKTNKERMDEYTFNLKIAVAEREDFEERANAKIEKRKRAEEERNQNEYWRREEDRIRKLYSAVSVGGTSMFGKQKTSLFGAGTGNEFEGENISPLRRSFSLTNEKSEKDKLKETEENLRTAMHAYNSVFFDPLKASFNAVATGSANMADAFIDSIKRMIAQLLEFAAASLILSSFGLGSFGAIFGQLSGIGGVLPTPVTTAGRSAGISRSDMASMSGSNIGSSRALQVEVIGKISNEAIYLSGNKYLSMKNASRI